MGILATSEPPFGVSATLSIFGLRSRNTCDGAVKNDRRVCAPHVREAPRHRAGRAAASFIRGARGVCSQVHTRSARRELHARQGFATHVESAAIENSVADFSDRGRPYEARDCSSSSSRRSGPGSVWRRNATTTVDRVPGCRRSRCAHPSARSIRASGVGSSNVSPTT